MATDERQWHRLYDRARQVLGEEEADALMARIPVAAWKDVATKQDLLEVKQDVLEVKQDIVALKQDLAAVEIRLETKFDTKLDTRIELLEHKLTAMFERGLRSQMRWILAWNTGLVFAIIRFA